MAREKQILSAEQKAKQQENSRAHYVRNREAILAASAKRYEEKRRDILAKQKARKEAMSETEKKSFLAKERERRKVYATNNKEKIAAYDRARRESDPVSFAAARKQRRSKPAVKAHEAEAFRRWSAANPDKVRAHTSKRRAAKNSAIPYWFGELDELIMLEAADLCARREKTTGIKWHIDHQVPLISKKVCGFHIGCNIAVIPAKENTSKGNRRWPDMP